MIKVLNFHNFPLKCSAWLSGINTNYTDLTDPVLKTLNLEIKEQILSTGDPAFHKRSFSGNQ